MAFLDQFQKALAGLQPLADVQGNYQNQQHMKDVFAVNPDFGQKLYGAIGDQAQIGQNDQRLRLQALQEERLMADYARKLKQQEALKALAGDLSGVNMRDPMERQKALAQYGQVSGDLEPMFGLAGGQNTPAAIQEYLFYQNLSPEDRKEYLKTKRSDQVINLGGKQVVRAPSGGLIENYDVTLKPEDMPQNAANKAAAIESAKLGEQLIAEPKITAANKTAELGAVLANDLIKKGKSAENTIQILDRAEKLLPMATGSLAGSVVAAGKGAVGISDESTQANTELDLLAGWLVANVPRMEGPQSNFDVINYQKMAADLGNKQKPVGDRLAALKGLRDLQAKYVDQNIDRPSDTKRKRFNPQTGKLE
jgi:hypothetical protein